MPKHSRLTDTQTYSIAHSAQCKLSMTAGEPDRNLRFMLGHAFLLDKALFRVAEIEEMGDEEVEVGKTALGDADEDETQEGNKTPEGKSGSLGGGSVAFSGDKDDHKPAEETLAIEDEYEDDGEGLGLTRFASASQMPPRLVPDEGDEEEEDEVKSPPSLPADLDIATVVQGPESEEINQMYDMLQGCPCHGKKAEKSKRFWEVKDTTGISDRPKKRLAIMQVDA